MFHKALFLCLSISFGLSIQAQNMTNERLGELLGAQSDTLIGRAGNWTFQAGALTMLCITDAEVNRMRIISPVAELKDISDEQLAAALAANFHSALDVRYAVADGIMWVAFIHPLRELSDEQVNDAVAQVYNAVLTFGDTYSSTDLIFPGGSSEEEEAQEEQKQVDGKDVRRF